MTRRNFKRVEALGTKRGNPVMTLAVCNNPYPMGCIKTDARQQISQILSTDATNDFSTQGVC